MKNPTATATILRHRYENWWYALCILITLLAFMAAFAAFMVDTQSLQDIGLSEEESRALIEDVELMVFLLLLPLGLWILRLMAESDIKTHAFAVDEALLPELMETLHRYAQALGLPKTPELYITSKELPEPLLKTICPKPRLLIIPADLATATGEEAGFRDYYLAREMAHLRLGYSHIWRNSLLVIPRLLQLPGSTLARAEAYSTDALAAQLAPEHALDAMLLEIFGSTLYSRVDREVYRQRWEAASTLDFEQALSDLPLPRERYLALYCQLNSQTPFRSDGRLF